MIFRDDHDAAIARGDALERELDQAKETAEEAGAKLAKADADRERLEAEVAELRAKLPEPPAPPTTPAAPTPPTHSLGTFAMVVVLAIGALVIVFLSLRQGPESATSNPTCTLVTEPPGATIVAIRRSRISELLHKTAELSGPSTYTMTVGTTPLSKTRQQWIIEGVTDSPSFVAQLAGYEPMPVASPLEGMGCSAIVYRLEPSHHVPR